MNDYNALIDDPNFSLHTAKNRHSNPPKIWDLEFKGEFRRFGLSSVAVKAPQHKTMALATFK